MASENLLDLTEKKDREEDPLTVSMKTEFETVLLKEDPKRDSESPLKHRMQDETRNGNETLDVLFEKNTSDVNREGGGKLTVSANYIGNKFFYQLGESITFTRKSSLGNDNVIHTGNRPSQCTDCGETLKTKTDSESPLKHRMQDETTNGNEAMAFSFEKNTSDVDVEGRGKLTVSANYIQNKFFLQLGEESFTFTRKSSLETYDVIHSGNRPSECTDCGETLKTKTDSESPLKHRIQDETTNGNEALDLSFKKNTSDVDIEGGAKVTVSTNDTSNRFSCQLCEKSFTRKSSLQIHSVIHSGNRPFQCTDCGETLKTKTDSESPLKHRMQDETTNGNEALDVSFEKNTSDVDTEVGGKVTVSANYIPNTFFLQLGEESFTFTRKSSLETYDVIHSGNRPSECTDCGETLKTKTDSESPLKHRIQDETRNGSEASVLSFEKNASDVDTEGGLVCSKKCKHKYDLARHLKIHKGSGYKCARCSKQFCSSQQLQEHLRTHTGEKPYQCTECKRCFKQRAHLARHVRQHTGERPHKCSICKKAFLTKYDLTVHIRVHTGEKPYHCDSCDLSFKDNSALKKHSFIHSGIKHHVCSYCKKAFSRRADLQNHNRTHTGEKPHVCSFCKKAFTLKGQLLNHTRRVHETRPKKK